MDHSQRAALIALPGLIGMLLLGLLGLSNGVAHGEESAANKPRSSVAQVALGEAGEVRFAVIGDFGTGSANERRVANLVKSWQPDFITTVGDNNYPSGAADTIDKNIGQFYSDYIYPYRGNYTSTNPLVPENRFWPTLGNHDWISLSCLTGSCSGPYSDYFTLPGNERYYDLVRGPLHLFFVDSDEREPDGFLANSKQAAWLQAGLAASQTPWQVILMHHVAYNSGRNNGPEPRLQWPFQAWGADAVLTGHEHLYERSIANGIPYIVNGVGGNDLRQFDTPRPCSEVRYNQGFGALLVETTAQTMTFQFINVANQLIDSYTLPAPATNQTCTSTHVRQGVDDAEESVITGTVSIDSQDLELVHDVANARDQVVGIRFQGLAIPPGAKILSATLELINIRAREEPTSLTIQGVAADHTQAFSPVPFSISTLPRTDAVVAWDNVRPWLNSGYPEPSPDLASILQEIVDRPGWQQGNAVTLIITGSGGRTARAYEDKPERPSGLAFKYEAADVLPTPTSTPPLESETPTPTPTSTTLEPGSSDHRQFLPFISGQD
jgi:hypothetical protein